VKEAASGGVPVATQVCGIDGSRRAAVTVSASPAVASVIRFDATGVARRRLVCLPYAGGGPATFRQWPQSLPADVEVVTVQLPGREPPYRQRPLNSVAAMVGSVLPALRDLTDLPFSIFGHSMGALVAFEITVALEDEGGVSPTHLFVSARRSPEEPSEASPVHHLPDDDFLDAVQGRYNAVPEIVRREPDLMALLLPVLRADIRAFETYEPMTGRKVRCPVHVYGGTDDRHPRPDQLARWQLVAEREIRVRVFDGDHFYLTSQRETLAADIAAAWSDSPTAAELT
jgi:medium-chain acyl-[acyl-carrier-protein] hydrolase